MKILDWLIKKGLENRLMNWLSGYKTDLSIWFLLATAALVSLQEFFNTVAQALPQLGWVAGVLGVIGFLLNLLGTLHKNYKKRMGTE